MEKGKILFVGVWQIKGGLDKSKPDAENLTRTSLPSGHLTPGSFKCCPCFLGL